MHISQLVLKSLKLNQIWWLVTSQNPLKRRKQEESISNRVLSTYIINKNYKIKTQALELKLGTKFTYDTIKKLKTIMPKVNFFWIMGSDNLQDMHNWYRWKDIFYLCPIIVVHRPNYFYKALSSKTAKYFWQNKLKSDKITKIKKLPAWCYLYSKPNYNSSTNLRKNVG